MAGRLWLMVLAFLVGSPASAGETLDTIQNTVVTSPSAPLSAPLPSGTAVADFEVSPVGSTVALILKEPGGKHKLAVWSFASRSIERTIDLPVGFGATSVAWHPDARRMFLILSGRSGHAIAKIDVGSQVPAVQTIYQTKATLRRVVVTTRPFETAKGTVHRLYFGEQQPDGAFATRTITENGDMAYTAIGRRAEKSSPNADPEALPNTLIAPWSLPVQFSAFGSTMIWEDKGHCLNKALYSRDNWSETTHLDQECGGSYSFAPNSAYLLHWKQDRSGVAVIGLFDHSRSEEATDERFISPPSVMPDGQGVVGIVKGAGGLELHFRPIAIPLADVTNAWMFISSQDSWRSIPVVRRRSTV
jgi:hypothetical protein